MAARSVIRAVVEWAAVLLVALGATLLLTSAAAYAADNWVLWSTHNWQGEERTDPDSAYTDRDECMHAVNCKLNNWGSRKVGGQRADIDMSDFGDGVGRVFFSTSSFVYRCLPAGVDPRGPQAR